MAGISLSVCGGVRSLGVLHLGCLHGNSVDDHGNVMVVPVAGVGVTSVPMSVPATVVVSIIPSSGAALGLSNGREMGRLGVGDFGGIGGCGGVSVSLGLGDGRKVHSLCVGDLSSVDDTAIGSQGSVRVDGSVDGLAGESAVVGSQVLGAGSLDLGGVQWHSLVDDNGGSAVPGRSLVDVVSETSVGGEMLSLSGGNLGGVVGHSGDGGMGGQVSGAGSLHFGGVDWDSTMTDHNWGSTVIDWGGRIVGRLVSPGSAVCQRSSVVVHLRLV